MLASICDGRRGQWVSSKLWRGAKAEELLGFFGTFRGYRGLSCVRLKARESLDKRTRAQTKASYENGPSRGEPNVWTFGLRGLSSTL